MRCRETFQREILRSRYYVVKFLARRALVYRDGKHWTQKHVAWLHGLAAADTLAPEDAVVLGEYLALLEYKIHRREELDRQIEALALSPAYRTAIAWLRCFRGVDTQAAMVLATEIGDWQRFTSPRHLMAYLGLVPREHSTGHRERRGAITKAGNSHCRHVLVQAAWAYRHRPRVGAPLANRQRGQPPGVVANAWKAQHRLHKVYRQLAYRKGHQVAVVAVARGAGRVLVGGDARAGPDHAAASRMSRAPTSGGEERIGPRRREEKCSLSLWGTPTAVESLI